MTCRDGTLSVAGGMMCMKSRVAVATRSPSRSAPKLWTSSMIVLTCFVQSRLFAGQHKCTNGAGTNVATTKIWEVRFEIENEICVAFLRIGQLCSLKSRTVTNKRCRWLKVIAASHVYFTVCNTVDIAAQSQGVFNLVPCNSGCISWSAYARAVLVLSSRILLYCTSRKQSSRAS